MPALIAFLGQVQTFIALVGVAVLTVKAIIHTYKEIKRSL